MSYNRSHNTRHNTRHNTQHHTQQQQFCSFCKNLNKNPFGHTVKFCPELKKINCKFCGKPGHTIKYCAFIERCGFCHRVGHNDKKCFYNPENDIPKCSHCEKFGHKYEECKFVSSKRKKEFIDEKKKLEKELKEQEKKRMEKQYEQTKKFEEKGFTYNIKYLHFCKKMFEKNSNYKPWLIFINEGKSAQEMLSEIKYQVKMLEC